MASGNGGYIPMPKFVLSCDVAKGKSTFGLFGFKDGSLETIKRSRNYALAGPFCLQRKSLSDGSDRLGFRS